MQGFVHLVEPLKKSILGVFEGNIFGHNILKLGLRIDPKRVKGIQEIPLPKIKQAIQSFCYHINFVSYFIPNFIEIAGPISNMLNKDHSLKWDYEAKNALVDMKHSLCQSLVVVGPDYGKDFQLFYFAYNSSMVVFLL